MKIIVLDSLVRQTSSDSKEWNASSDIPKYVIPKIFREIQRLAELEQQGKSSIDEYLKNHHGIKMKGVEKIYKYELTDGDRILYAHSKDFPWLNRRVEDSYVLLQFSKHDDQGETAKKYDLTKERGYKYIKEIVDTMSKLDIDAINKSAITLSAYVTLAEILNSDDYTEWHRVYVIDGDRDYSKLTLEEMDIYLSQEQSECISDFFRNPSPTLIIGGAGTGKTLISVHLLIDYVKNNHKKRACYFTQSPELRTKVKTLYKQYGTDIENNEVEFNDINEYCIKQLGLNHKNLVTTHDFLKYLKTNPAIMSKWSDIITPIEVWAEIRGVIKGCMSGSPTEWNRIQPMLQDSFDGGVESLVKKGYFERLPSDKKRIQLKNSLEVTKERAANDTGLNSREIENLKDAFKYFSNFDFNKRTLTKEEYLGISEERTTIAREHRELAWNVCMEYEKYLQDNELYDENDLIRRMFEKGITSESKYNFTVIDEVQDYTELQLFFIRTLTEGNKIVFAGDEHQNINPASFSESRLSSLFYQESVSLTTKRLQKNYRCPQEIIEKTNELAEIRRCVIASGKAKNEVPEVAIRASDALPNRLVYNESNIEECLCELIQYPKAVILVPNQNVKSSITNKIKKLKDKIISRIGEAKYKARLNNAVFTVAEIKGMEYEYVLCFDLIGTYLETWKQILKKVHQQTKYRYYFNLLYVAMTRAQKYLCFIDTPQTEKLNWKIKFNPVSRFNAEELYFDQMSQDSASYYEIAPELEKHGKYKEAIENYSIAEAEPESLYRCYYGIAIEDKDYDKAIQFALLLDSTERITDYLNDITSQDLKTLAEVYVCLKQDPLNYRFKNINISGLIEKCIPEDTYREQIQKVMLSSLHNALRIHTEELSVFVSDIS